MIYWWGGRAQHNSVKKYLTTSVKKFLSCWQPYTLFHVHHQHSYTSRPIGSTMVKNRWFLNWESTTLTRYGPTRELRSSQITSQAFMWTSVNMLGTLTPRSQAYSMCWLWANPTRHCREKFHHQTVAQRMICGGFLNDCFCEQKPTPLNVDTSDARKILRTKEF